MPASDVGTAFRGVTFALNVESPAKVDAVIAELRALGVTVTKEPQDESWGGRSAYFADPEGNLWVERFRIVPSDPGTADVFDPSARLLGSVAIPPGLQVTRIGRDYVLGVWRDATDLEHVRMYRLVKPGP